MYGFENKMISRIKVTEVMLKITNFSLIISELGLFIYICIVVGFGDTSDINHGIVLFIAGVMLIAKFLRTVNYVLMMAISDRIAKDIEEISK